MLTIAPEMLDLIFEFGFWKFVAFVFLPQVLLAIFFVATMPLGSVPYYLASIAIVAGVIKWDIDRLFSPVV